MVFNFLAGGAGINVLARHAGAQVVVDVGVNYDFNEVAGLIQKKVVHGTKIMAKGPAMSRQETLRCIEAGSPCLYSTPIWGLTCLQPVRWESPIRLPQRL